MKPLSRTLQLCIWLFIISTSSLAQGATTHLVLRFIWNPSGCALELSGTECTVPPFKAFTADEFAAIDEAAVTAEQEYCGTNLTSVATSIPAAVAAKMACIWRSDNGDNNAKWTQEWNNWGTCTGFSIDQYFTLASNELWPKFNPNDVMADLGIKPPTVDRDTFVQQLSTAWGARAWLICDIATKALNRVAVCLDPKPPYAPKDCPWGVTRPSKYLAECAGQLSLPLTGAVAVSPACTQYIPRTYETVYPAPVTPSPPTQTPASPPSPSPSPASPSPVTVATSFPPPPPPLPAAEEDLKNSSSSSSSESSSSNIGVIVGAIIGGVAVAVAIAASIVYIMHKKRRNDSANAKRGGLPTASEVNNNWDESSHKMSPYAAPPPAIPVPGTASFGYAYATSPPSEGWNTRSTSLGLQNPAKEPNGGAVYDLPGPSQSAFNSSVTNRGGIPDSAHPDPMLAYIKSTLRNTSAATADSRGSRGSLAAWEMRFSDLDVKRPIGVGSWGAVFEATWLSSPVAVKLLLSDGTGGGHDARRLSARSSLLQIDAPTLARLNQEFTLMSKLHHPCVVQFFGITTSPAAIVTEFCQRGSLLQVLANGMTSPERAAELTWARRISLAADSVRGMIYLHSQTPPVIHRDLKSGNVVVTHAWQAKLCDFNLSRVLQDASGAKSATVQAMNPRWLAPEILRGEAYTLASDVYAFGVVLWELLVWDVPWGFTSPWAIVGAISAGGRPPLPAQHELPGPDSGAWPKLGEYVLLMQQCWAQDPAARPPFLEVMERLKEIEPTVAQN